MFVDQPDVWKFLFYALPPDLMLGAAAGLALARPALFDTESLRRVPRSSGVLGLGLALLPLLFIFGASRLFGLRIWVPRYFVCCELGVALSAGLLLAHVRNRRALRAAAACMAAAALCTRTRLYHINEDWAGAVAYASAQAEALKAPLLLTCPYVESLQPGWLQDASKKDYLAAPLSFYTSGRPAVLLPLPWGPAGDGAARAALAAASGAGAVVLLSLGDDNYNERMARAMLSLGLRPLASRPGPRFPKAFVYSRAAAGGK
jgi:hypothetical protein